MEVSCGIWGRIVIHTPRWPRDLCQATGDESQHKVAIRRRLQG